MTDVNVLIQQFFVHERSRKRRSLVVLWSTVVLVDVFAVGAYFGGMGVERIAAFLAVPVLASFALLWRSMNREKSFQTRLAHVLDAVEFGWEELHGLDLNAEEAERLHEAFTAIAVGRSATNETELQTRGGDEKGPAFDRKDAIIDPNRGRVDPNLHEDEYLGLEGELRVSERLVEEANQQYAEHAQRQWEVAEARDLDNIEAGVKRLGDLVASGWFEQNAKDGALSELMESHEDPGSE